MPVSTAIALLNMGIGCCFMFSSRNSTNIALIGKDAEEKGRHRSSVLLLMTLNPPAAWRLKTKVAVFTVRVLPFNFHGFGRSTGIRSGRSDSVFCIKLKNDETGTFIFGFHMHSPLCSSASLYQGRIISFPQPSASVDAWVGASGLTPMG